MSPNVLRCLQLEAHGYKVSVTELVGWEHSMKNELIIASYKDLPRRRAGERLNALLQNLGLEELQGRFFHRFLNSQFANVAQLVGAGPGARIYKGRQGISGLFLCIFSFLFRHSVGYLCDGELMPNLVL